MPLRAHLRRLTLGVLFRVAPGRRERALLSEEARALRSQVGRLEERIEALAALLRDRAPVPGDE